MGMVKVDCVFYAETPITDAMYNLDCDDIVTLWLKDFCSSVLSFECTVQTVHTTKANNTLQRLQEKKIAVDFELEGSFGFTFLVTRARAKQE